MGVIIIIIVSDKNILYYRILLTQIYLSLVHWELIYVLTQEVWSQAKLEQEPILGEDSSGLDPVYKDLPAQLCHTVPDGSYNN